MHAPADKAHDGALLKPTTVDELLAHRFVLLSTFAKFAPGFSRRTLQQWAESGKLPAERRVGGRWWVDLHRLRKSAGTELAHLLDEDPNAAA